mmetsp:Transcript_13971/g.41118  ORF Transcript_13971/g.41118 Transcript_13971/m.41118 type:complete len:202 (-) Transcript_13971:530-1135(-)
MTPITNGRRCRFGVASSSQCTGGESLSSGLTAAASTRAACSQISPTSPSTSPLAATSSSSRGQRTSRGFGLWLKYSSTTRYACPPLAKVLAHPSTPRGRPISRPHSHTRRRACACPRLPWWIRRRSQCSCCQGLIKGPLVTFQLRHAHAPRRRTLTDWPQPLRWDVELCTPSTVARSSSSEARMCTSPICRTCSPTPDVCR